MHRLLLITLSLITLPLITLPFFTFSIAAVESPYTMDKVYYDNLPELPLQTLYIDSAKEILISGKTGDYLNSDERLYLWKYNTTDNSASFISSVSFSVPSELVSYNNISLVGAYNKNYYALLQSNYDASTKLVRFTLNNNQLLLTQGVHLPPEAANDFM
ncbi:MAG: hypothetical protein ACRDBI_07660, partial [Shewanella sp.]